jgi:16S rRNA (uracil1498-N3)-methyltransferase
MADEKYLTRLYFPGDIPAHGRCALAPEQAHHASRVLRLGTGDRLVLFDGRGNEYAATIASVGKSGVCVDVGEPCAVDRESPLAVTLAQGLSSGERMDYTVQKAVELGVACIQPLATERSLVRLDGERARKRAAHWQAVAAAACEQCGRNRVPPVLPLLPLATWLDRMRGAAGARFVLSPQAAAGLRALARPAGPIVLLAGPEGGLSARERGDAEAAGFAALRLGPRVLRTETAAVAALAALQALWGDF